MRRLAALTALGLCAVFTTGAGYQVTDEAAERREMVARLSRNINKVDHSIQVTKDLVERSNDAPYRADLILRLAELYVERSRYVYARLMEQQPAGVTTLEADKALEVQISKRLAIETYDRVLRDFPDYEKNDQVRFFRAHEYRELGEFDTMLAQYRELIDQHPKSLWALEAHLILADHAFDQGNLAEAETHYAEIMAAPESHLHDMARYKMGWIRINQDKHKAALSLFQEAVQSARQTRKGAVGDAAGLDVKREALLAMAWPFTETHKASEAAEYFRGLCDSKTIYLEVLERLANRYFVKTDYQSAASLYREIVAYSSNVEKNIEYLQRIYDSVRNLSEKSPRRYARAATDVAAIAETLAQFQNHWKFSDEEKTHLARDFEIRARDLATRLHKDAQAKKDDRRLHSAARAYGQYLSVFAGAEQVRDMQNNRAEVLSAIEDHVGAGRQYEDIARAQENGPERQANLYSAILSYYTAIEADTAYRVQHPEKPGLLDKLQLLRAREGLKQLGAFYVRTWPKNENVPTIKFNIARMSYQQGEYERAAELFEAFVEDYPTGKDTATAVELALDALNKREMFDAMSALAKRIVENPNIQSNEVKTRAAAIAEGARKRKLELVLLETDSADFGQVMLDEWEKHQGTEQGEEALHAAFTKYTNEWNIEGALDFGGRLVGAYPDSPRVGGVLATMGTVALRAGDFERAAVIFEQLYERRSADENALPLLASAARIRLLLGDVSAATESLRILRSKGDAQQQRNAHQLLMEAFDQAGDWESLASVASTAKKAAPNGYDAGVYLGIAYAAQGKLELARREVEAAVRTTPKSDFDEALVARAAFTLGQVTQAELEAVPIRDASAVESAVAKKLELLGAVEQAYVKTIGAGDALWIVAALHESARLYAGFGEMIGSLPAPDGMSDADREAYRNGLAEQAAPYRQQAADTLTACKARAESLRVFTPYAAACMRDDLGVVGLESRRRRTRSGGGDSVAHEAAEMRRQLAKQPESIDLVLSLSRLIIQTGDYHLAHLMLSKAAETNTDNPQILNLLGVSLWMLGDTQGAFTNIQAAHDKGLNLATANLAALYAAYGYILKAAEILGTVEGLQTLDLTVPDLHPSVASYVRSAGAG